MRKLFQGVQDRLAAFVEQRDDLALVVRCPAHESGYLLKMLQAVGESNDHALFWTFADPFENTTRYASAVIANLAAQREAACKLLEGEGKPAWPPLPERAMDVATPPAERLREAMVWCRALLPLPDDQLTIWTLFPLEMADPAAFAAFVDDLLRHEFPNPWCHHMRVFVREDVASPALSQRFAERPRVDYFAPDLSPEAMEKALEDEVADPAVPLDQRVQGLLMLAVRDSAHGRTPRAMQEFETCFRFFRAKEDHLMTALTLNSMAETYARLGDLAKARALFESALTPAIESKCNPMLMIVSLGLGNLHLQQQRWDEAELYYDSAEKIARALCVPQTTIQALESLGYCQYAQGKIEEAVASWEGGATLAQSMEETELQRGLFARLLGHWERVGERRRASEIREQLAALPPAPRPN